MTTDRYELGARIGAGTFATVHHGTDPRLGSSVAIKMLDAKWSADPLVCERFGREATLLRRIRSHRRSAPLVEVFDIDQTSDGRPFFVMSFADRGTLADRWVEGQRWPCDQVHRVAQTLADGLYALHQEGVVHRDIKPSNLLYISEADALDSEQLLIGDLGLAKDLLSTTTDLTLAGGTPRYMAPEQQFADAPITPAADIWSATIVVNELLTGHRRLGGTSELSPGLRAWTERGTAPNFGDRYESILTWRDELFRCLSAAPVEGTTHRTPGEPASSNPSADTAAASSKGRSRLVVFAVGVLALVATIGIIALMLLSGTPEIRIDGPADVPVGQRALYQADVPADGVYFWTVGDKRVVESDLEILPQTLGNVRVQLSWTNADGSTSMAIRDIAVVDDS